MKNVIGIAGSLRRGSFNRRLIHAAAEQAPSRMTVRAFDTLEAIPLFNEDLEIDGGPESVRMLRQAVAEADGVLIATPEYNWSIPGVLKNAIDWLSRDAPVNVLAQKPVAIIGASSGRWGTRLAQAALRQVLTSTESLVLAAPAMFVRDAASAFDAQRLADPVVCRQLDSVLRALDEWIDITQGAAHVRVQ